MIGNSLLKHIKYERIVGEVDDLIITPQWDNCDRIRFPEFSGSKSHAAVIIPWNNYIHVTFYIINWYTRITLFFQINF